MGKDKLVRGKDKGFMQSRTKNVSINIVVGLFCQGITMILGFVCRTVFIKTLGKDYLGVDGLFSNVLTILSFAELGIGDAIIFSLYKPIAMGDHERISSLMDLYRKCYRIIGIVIAVAGLCLTPFLGYVMKNKPNIPENLTLLYWLFLANTATSYFFVYKNSIIIADQKNYIVLLLTQFLCIAQNVVQIIFLYLTHNYIIYLLLHIAATLTTNVVVCLMADRMYPYLKKKAVPLAKDERRIIFKNVQALVLYKFGNVALNGTDNILVSALVGVREVGLVSNYTLLIACCKAILFKFTEAFTASVGNLNAISSNEKKYEVFNELFMVIAWIYGLASVGLATVANPLISVWLGNEYLLSALVTIAIVSEFYFQGIQFAASTYRTTLGYFVQSKYVPIWMSIVNIVLSILFCKWIGLAGIFFASSIARLLGTTIVDPYLIYTKAFHKTPLIYLSKYVGYTLLLTVIAMICNGVITNIDIGGWFGVIVKIVVVIVIFNALMLLIFCRTKAFNDLIEHFKHLLTHRNSII